MAPRINYRRIFIALIKLLIRIMGQPSLKNPTKEFKALIRGMEKSHPEEVEIYDAITTYNSLPVKLFVTSSCILVVHHLLMPYELFSSIDFISPEKNIKLINPTDSEAPPLSQFQCFVTNCSRLTRKPNDLAKDFLRLNYFSVCHPEYLASPFFHPVDNLNWGKFNHLFVAMTVLVFGVVYPLAINVSSFWSQSIMVSAAPNVTQKIICARLEALYSDYSLSLSHFKAATIKMREQVETRSSRHLAFRFRKKESQPLMRSLQIPLATDAAKERVSSLEDCLSIVQTNWWSDRQVRSTVLLSFILFNGVGSAVASLTLLPLVCLYLWHLEELLDIRKFMRASNCALWLADGAANSTRPSIIDPLDGDFKFSIYNPSLLLLYFAIFFSILCFTLSILFTLVLELNMRLIELEFMISVAGEMMRLKDQSGIRKASQESVRPAKSLPRVLRDQIIKTMKINSVGIASTSIRNILAVETRSDIRPAFERLAIKCLVEQGSDSYGDLIEKAYFNFRQFLETVRSYDPWIGSLAIVLHLVVYSCASLCIFLRKNAKDSLFHAFFLLGIYMTMVLAAITYGANLNTNVSKIIDRGDVQYEII